MDLWFELGDDPNEMLYVQVKVTIRQAPERKALICKSCRLPYSIQKNREPRALPCNHLNCWKGCSDCWRKMKAKQQTIRCTVDSTSVEMRTEDVPYAKDVFKVLEKCEAKDCKTAEKVKAEPEERATLKRVCGHDPAENVLVICIDSNCHQERAICCNKYWNASHPGHNALTVKGMKMKNVKDELLRKLESAEDRLKNVESLAIENCRRSFSVNDPTQKEEVLVRIMQHLDDDEETVRAKYRVAMTGIERKIMQRRNKVNQLFSRVAKQIIFLRGIVHVKESQLGEARAVLAEISELNDEYPLPKWEDIRLED